MSTIADNRNSIVRRFVDDASEWARGRWWVPRLALWLWLAWILRNHLRDPLYASLFAGLDLGVHELGHLLFSPFGRLLGIAGGTIAQCALPLLALSMFLRQRDYFAIAVAVCWLGINLFAIAVYVADASAQVLPLVSPFAGEPIHDWNYLLTRFGAIERDRVIARQLQTLGTASMALGLAYGGWLLWRMAVPRGDAAVD